MSLKIDISSILHDVGQVLSLDTQEKLSYPDEDFFLTAPVTIRGEITNLGDTLLLSADIKTKVCQTCGRCLSEYDHPLEFNIEEEYSLTKIKTRFKKEAEIKPEDIIFEIENDNTIDLSEVIRQNIIMALPIKPLCSKEEN